MKRNQGINPRIQGLFGKIDENDTNAKALKAKRRTIILEKANKV